MIRYRDDVAGAMVVLLVGVTVLALLTAVIAAAVYLFVVGGLVPVCGGVLILLVLLSVILVGVMEL